MSLQSAPSQPVSSLVRLEVPGADTVNFLGYVVWSVWLVVLAARIL
jgi:hypothetical protein